MREASDVRYREPPHWRDRPPWALLGRTDVAEGSSTQRSRSQPGVTPPCHRQVRAHPLCRRRDRERCSRSSCVRADTRHNVDYANRICDKKALRSSTSRASCRRSAGRAFQAGSIARQGEVAALGAGVACVALEAGVFASTRFLAGGRHGDRRFCRDIGRDRGRRRGFVREVILRFRRTGRSEGHWFRGDRGVGGEVLEAADVSGVRGSRNMSEIVSTEVGDGTACYALRRWTRGGPQPQLPGNC